MLSDFLGYLAFATIALLVLVLFVFGCAVVLSGASSSRNRPPEQQAPNVGEGDADAGYRLSTGGH